MRALFGVPGPILADPSDFLQKPLGGHVEMRGLNVYVAIHG